VLYSGADPFLRPTASVPPTTPSLETSLNSSGGEALPSAGCGHSPPTCSGPPPLDRRSPRGGSRGPFPHQDLRRRRRPCSLPDVVAAAPTLPSATATRPGAHGPPAQPGAAVLACPMRRMTGHEARRGMSCIRSSTVCGGGVPSPCRSYGVVPSWRLAAAMVHINLYPWTSI